MSAFRRRSIQAVGRVSAFRRNSKKAIGELSGAVGNMSVKLSATWRVTDVGKQTGNWYLFRQEAESAPRL